MRKYKNKINTEQGSCTSSTRFLVGTWRVSGLLTTLLFFAVLLMPYAVKGQSTMQQIFMLSTGASNDASFINTNEVRLTQNAQNRRGAVWTQDKCLDFAKPFTISFQASFGTRTTNGADGIAVVFQNSGTAAIGDNGGGIGANTIPLGLALELDTWDNTDQLLTNADRSGSTFYNHGAIWRTNLGGMAGGIAQPLSGPTILSSSNPNYLEDGNWHTVTVTWNAAASNPTISFTVNGFNAGSYTYSGTLNNFCASVFGIAGTVTEKRVYWGFTSGTGNDGWNEHRVRFPSGIPAPTISVQPVDRSVCLNETTSLSVASTGGVAGTGSHRYQWQRSSNGTSGWTNIAGETSSTYTPPTNATGTVYYRVIVSSLCASVTSAVSTVTVNATTAITTQPTNLTVCVGATTGRTLSVTATGTGLTYQWQFLIGSTWAHISGATSSTYDALTTTAGTTSYRVIVTGTCGSVTSATRTVTVNPVTAITSQPSNITVCAGVAASERRLSVTATGTGTLTYQWQSSTNGTSWSNISGATGTTYDAPNTTGIRYYRVNVTGTCGTATSNAATVTVNAATAITTQPVNLTVCQNATTGRTLSVTATGTGTLTYRWQSLSGSTWSNIPGAFSSTYNAPTTTAGTTSYRVVVTGTCGNVTSATRTVTVNPATAITTQPTNLTVCQNATTGRTLSVTATGTGLGYQWQSSANGTSGWTNISGATGTTYDAPNNLGVRYYRAVVTGTCSSETSNSATVTVNVTTAITIHPSNLTVCVGATTGRTLSVTATGTGLTYQWQSSPNGTTWSNISGATSSTYNAPTTTAGTTSYRVTVTGTCGAVTSATRTVTVNATTAISTQPTNLTVCVGATTGRTLSVTATGTGTLTYQWQSLSGSTWSNISGATSSSYNAPTTTAGTTSYRVVVTGTCGSVTSATRTVTVNAATAISTQPTNLTVCVGATTGRTLSVTATGTGTLTYQWQSLSGSTWSNISGATSSTYNAPTTTAGTISYRVIVTGTCGSVTSATRTVTVNAATAITTQPSNITSVCIGATTGRTLSVTATGTGLTYQWQRSTNGTSGWTNISGATSSSYDAPTTTAGETFYRVIVTGTCGTVTSVVRIVIVDPTTAITTHPSNLTVCVGTTTGRTLSVTATMGLGMPIPYQWQSSSNGTSGWTNISGATSNTYNAPTTTAGTTYYRVVVTGTCGTATSNTATVTVNATQPPIFGSVSNLTVCQNATTGRTLSISTPVEATFQWQRSTNGTSGWTNISGATSYSYDAPTTTAGTTYYRVVVTGTCGTATSNTGSVTVNAATAISTQPTNLTVCEGATTGRTLSVTATGVGLTYQWQSLSGSTWSNISGATSSTYNTSTTTAGTTSYRVVVTGTCGSVTSATRTVTVNPATAITSQPSNITVCAGVAASERRLSVTATGTGTLTYQWQSSTNGTSWSNISGATGTTYDAPNTTGVRYYRVNVTGTCGTATSNAATVTVNAATAISTQPTNLTVCVGATTGRTLSVTATGVGLTYQWQSSSNGTSGWTNISGATSNTYNAPTTTAGTTYYRVVVTGTCGTATSNTATVTVNATQPPIFGSVSNLTVCQNATTGRTLSISTPVEATFQWQRSTNGTSGWTNISGATSYSYDAPTTTAGTTYYRVVVTGTCGTATSNTGSVTVNAATAISTQPTNLTVCVGATTGRTLSVTATGVGLTYQWQSSSNGTSGWTNISGATSNTYNAPTTTAGTTYYRVNVTGTCGSVTSATRTVTVNAATAISTQPTNLTFCEGAPAAERTFSVAASGTGTLTYQWERSTNGGSTWANAGTGTTYVAPANSTTATVSHIRVRVTGTCGTVTSNTVTATINRPVAITSQPSNITVCAGVAASERRLSVTATGAGLTYQWQSSTNGTSWSNISGATGTTYDAPNTVGVRYYRAVVTGTCGTATSNSATVTVNAATAITSQPSNITVCAGVAASERRLSVTATGTGTLTYQWQSSTNGTSWSNISGATGTTYDAPNTTGIRYYRVNVTGTCGTATSNTATVTVNALPVITAQPSDVAVCQGASRPDITVVATGTGLTYQWQISEDGGTTWRNINLSENSTANQPSYSFSTGVVRERHYRAVVTNSAGCSVTSSVAKGTVTAPPSAGTLSGTQAVCGGATTAFSSTVTGGSWTSSNTAVATVNATTGVITGVAAGTATITYTVAGTGGCADATATRTVTVNALRAVSGTANATVCAGSAVNLSRPTTGVTGIGTAKGLPAGVTATWASNTITISGTPTTAGTYNYSIPLNGASCGTATATGTITVNDVTVITTQPTNLTVCEGAPAAKRTFSVAASGTGTLTYQWERSTNGGSTWANAGTGTTYVAPANSTTATVSHIRVRVTGTCGTVTSNTVTATINRPVAITSQPSNITVCAGVAASERRLSVTATGAGLTYQWQSSTNGTSWSNISGAIGTTYDAPNTTGVRYYRVNVTGTCGSVTSNTATVTVNPETTVTNPTAVTDICVGAAAGTRTLTVTAGGAGTLTYLWEQSANGSTGWTAAIGTNNTPTYVAPATASGTTYYRVRVTGTCGIATSANARVNVTANMTVTAGTTTTVCIDNAMPDRIHTTTGATGIGTATGLPAGVTATFSTVNNRITISGTPTQSGTFNYTVPLTGGCGTATATGRINVGTGAQSVTAEVCTGKTLQLSGDGVYTTSNPLVATVDNFGLVHGLAVGTVDITYTNAGGCTITHTITVKQCRSVLITNPMIRQRVKK